MSLNIENNRRITDQKESDSAQDISDNEISSSSQKNKANTQIKRRNRSESKSPYKRSKFQSERNFDNDPGNSTELDYEDDSGENILRSRGRNRVKTIQNKRSRSLPSERKSSGKLSGEAEFVTNQAINETVTTPKYNLLEIALAEGAVISDGKQRVTSKERGRSRSRSNSNSRSEIFPSRITTESEMTENEITFKNNEKINAILNNFRKSKSRSRSKSRSSKKKHRRSRKRKTRSKHRRKHKRRHYSSSSSSSSSSSEDEASPKLKKKPKRFKRSKDEEMIDLEDDPRIQEIVKRMVREQVDSELAKSNKGKNEIKTPQKIIAHIPNKLKSPSDFTVYTPAVRQQGGTDHINIDFLKDKLDFFKNSRRNINELPSEMNTQKASNQGLSSSDSSLDQIDNFLTAIRLGGESSRTTQPGREDKEAQMRKARQSADDMIIEAEKFKASIQQPKGESTQIDNKKFSLPLTESEIMLARYHDRDDDDFFHITCHVDSNLRIKIERGEFVELEKLLQKNSKLENTEEGRKMSLVNKNGVSYFVPQTDRECKINNVRKWEQAFRTYAAIYCNKNPNRSVEVLQYVDVINKAAATFSWENVARYDYTFRQLMAVKPYRSWAKTYTQMWNLTLNDPVKRFSNENGYHTTNSSNNKGNKKGDNTCWKFNKNKCPFTSRECNFEHRCSYCLVMGHPQISCYKKNGKKDQKGGKPSGSGDKTQT